MATSIGGNSVISQKRRLEYHYDSEEERDDDDVSSIHSLQPDNPLKCPNWCGIFSNRQDLEDHVAKDCPFTLVDCDFHHIGCDMTLPRKDMPAHLEENLVTHVSLQAASHNKLLISNRELQERVKQLELENKALRQCSGISLFDRGSYVEFTIENFKQLKDEWYSPPFYTQPNAYKFCLRVGTPENKSTYLTVGIYLMKGEFDDHLIDKWPFRGQITVQLVDQEAKGKHCSISIRFTDQTPDDVADRVTQEERNEKGLGNTRFISVDKLKPKFLKNDCLCFRVMKSTC